MDFYLSPELLALTQLARQVATEMVAPRAVEMDRSGAYPYDLFAVFKETGLLGVAVPEEFGGAGLGTTGLVLAAEEIAKVSSAASLILMLTRLPLAPILYGGTAYQKWMYATATVSGELRGAMCVSEPDAGSDAAGIKTTAVASGEKYRIDGTKSWVSGAAVADYFVVAAKTDPEAGARGISLFLVEKGTPGLTVGPEEKKMGGRGVSVHPVTFEACEVPAENLVGPENRGFAILMKTLNAVRPLVAARGLGLAQGALQYAIDYTRHRFTFGKPVIENQGIQWMMAELATKIEAARLLTYRAAQMVDDGKAGKQTTHFLAMAKWYATEVAQQVATDAIQFLGAVGFTEDHPLERFYRDVKQLTIVEGTTQIQKGIIGRALVEGNLFW